MDEKDSIGMTTPDAIVCLTRGYAAPRLYDQLINRNRSVYETINGHRTHQYPLIIWHQGDIIREHQRYILAREANADVRFVDVSAVFRLPGGIKESELIESWSVGYRLMCRFHTFHIWQYTRQFRYVMRLDEDCTLSSVGFDPIKCVSGAGVDFAAAAFVQETHELTNRTLAPFANKYAGVCFPQMRHVNFYNQSFPYTNLYVTRTAFWRQPELRRFLYAVIRERDSIRFRWGDLPVLGVALNMFARPGKVVCIPNLTYMHASNNLIVVSPQARKNHPKGEATSSLRARKLL
jgi:hypothetical protein